MPIYNFQQRFWPFIQDGSKQHTIRTIRRHPCKIGDTMYLYGGLRQPGAKRLIEPPLCTAKNTIFIMPSGVVIMLNKTLTKNEAMDRFKDSNPFFFLELKILTTEQKDALAWYDGFRNEDNPHITAMPGSWKLMFKAWQKLHPLPFAGHIDIWHPYPETLQYINHT